MHHLHGQRERNRALASVTSQIFKSYFLIVAYKKDKQQSNATGGCMRLPLNPPPPAPFIPDMLNSRDSATSRPASAVGLRRLSDHSLLGPPSSPQLQQQRGTLATTSQSQLPTNVSGPLQAANLPHGQPQVTRSNSANNLAVQSSQRTNLQPNPSASSNRDRRPTPATISATQSSSCKQHSSQTHPDASETDGQNPQSPHPKIKPEKKCVICTNTKDVYNYRKLMACSSCITFMKRASKDNPTFICSRAGDCEVHCTLKAHPLCSSCRLAKAKQLGMLHSVRLAEHQSTPSNRQRNTSTSDREQQQEQAPRQHSPQAPTPSSSALSQPATPRQTRNMSSGTGLADLGITDEELELSLALEVSLREYEQQEEHLWEDAGALLDPASSAPAPELFERVEPPPRAPTPHVILPNAERRQVYTKEENEQDYVLKYGRPASEEPELDEYGLPNNLSSRFNRWLYNNLNNFRPGDMTPKKPEDEVESNGPDRVTKISNDIGAHGLSLITQNLEPEEPQVNGEITVPMIEFRPSVSLRESRNKPIPSSSNDGDDSHNTNANGMIESSEESETASSQIRLPRKKPNKLTILLDVRRVNVDRAPMLKRLKTDSPNYRQRSDQHTITNGKSVSSTSLIGPGEDCDGSEDDEYIAEIDCDIPQHHNV